ncbi:hypothetical protein EZ242_14290 [Ramlibacter rhizophilus]|uniref:Uncharacterized protein n=1 Tax=Ramlibacter rhizophilus TaxID=1781167 RepID=A0A4Z0BH80_9BURK|nr:hypothetical protein EZ242_14290 [Ramlibacter rhizophilus]
MSGAEPDGAACGAGAGAGAGMGAGKDAGCCSVGGFPRVGVVCATVPPPPPPQAASTPRATIERALEKIRFVMFRCVQG